MNILMNSSDNNVRDNGTKDDGDGYGGDIVNNWSGGCHFGSGRGSGWSNHGSGWSGTNLGADGNGFGLTRCGLDNNDGVGS